MRLEEDVLDRSGRLLATADTELTDRHIRVFKSWGIAQARITHGQPDIPAGQPPISIEARQQAMAAAQHLFRLANLEHPAMARLHALSVERLAKRLQDRMKP